MTLAEAVNRHVENLLSSSRGQPKVRDDKVVGDPVHGASTFRRHEVHVIDSPIVQRLRGIHQTGLAYLVYPTATHSRFEHSLGTCIVASRFWRSLRQRDPKIVTDECLTELRLAGLLHDVGHFPFSHVSEDVLGQLPELRSELLKRDGKFSNCEPHEVMSYFVITSKAFRDFLSEIMSKYRQEFDVDNIANMVIGNMENPQKDKWKGDVINGPFDSDKLDYMLRDSHFSGVRLEVDIDRVLFTLIIDPREGEMRKLIARIAGVHTLEQIMFNKLLLFASIYHHHTVRAVESMIRSVLEFLLDDKHEIHGHRYVQPSDFLALTDYDILARHDSPALNRIAHCLKNRLIYKRVAVISPRTVTEASRVNLVDLQKLTEFPAELKPLRQLIANGMGSLERYHDLWVDVPENPSLREPPKVDVQIDGNSYKDINSLFPLSGWLQAYSENRWTGHVFCFPRDREKAFPAAKQTFLDVYGIELDDSAKAMSKVDWPEADTSAPEISNGAP